MMVNKIIRIKLKSDLCVHSGESYNTTVDVDVCYEEHGIPYIPAKRLKGCIREAALELVDFGAYDKKTYNEVFGTEGINSSKFTIDNAYIKNHDDICDEIETCTEKKLVHPQKVLGLYTYIRNQTSLENGVAKDTTLRSIRVVKKGLEFFSEITVKDGISEEGLELLEKAVLSVKHIGVSRTRGLGMIEMKMQDPDSKTQSEDEKSIYKFEIGEKNKIYYTIKLRSAVLCKSDEGNQNRTKNYFEGGKILGLLAGALGQEKYKELMIGDVIVSNAYIANGVNRCTPTSKALFKKKDQQFDCNGEMHIINRLREYEGSEQITPIGYVYMDHDKYVKGVTTEINYHHKRPEDKSLGRANGLDESSFYQLESICAGQVFKGYIISNKKETEMILEAFNKMHSVRIGYGRSAEYGKVNVTVDKVEILAQTQKELCKEFAVKLNSPAILYDEKAMATASSELFKNALEEILETKLDCNAKFLANTIIGGFNVTWNRKKPVINALDSGTTCVYKAESPVDISVLNNIHIGERVNEGFGEIELIDLPDKAADNENTNDVIRKETVPKKSTGDSNISDKMKKEIILGLLRDNDEKSEIRIKARKMAEELKEANMTATAVNKLLLIMNSKNANNKINTYEDIKKEIEGIETDSTKNNVNKFIAACDKIIIGSDNKKKLLCLREMLTHLKYLLREKKLNSKEEMGDE